MTPPSLPLHSARFMEDLHRSTFVPRVTDGCDTLLVRCAQLPSELWDLVLNFALSTAGPSNSALGFELPHITNVLLHFPRLVEMQMAILAMQALHRWRQGRARSDYCGWVNYRLLAELYREPSYRQLMSLTGQRYGAMIEMFGAMVANVVLALDPKLQREEGRHFRVFPTSWSQTLCLNNLRCGHEYYDDVSTFVRSYKLMLQCCQLIVNHWSNHRQSGCRGKMMVVYLVMVHATVDYMTALSLDFWMAVGRFTTRLFHVRERLDLFRYKSDFLVDRMVEKQKCACFVAIHASRALTQTLKNAIIEYWNPRFHTISEQDVVGIMFGFVPPCVFAVHDRTGDWLSRINMTGHQLWRLNQTQPLTHLPGDWRVLEIDPDNPNECLYVVGLPYEIDGPSIPASLLVNSTLFCRAKVRSLTTWDDGPPTKRSLWMGDSQFIKVIMPQNHEGVADIEGMSMYSHRIQPSPGQPMEMLGMYRRPVASLHMTPRSPSLGVNIEMLMHAYYAQGEIKVKPSSHQVNWKSVPSELLDPPQSLPLNRVRFEDMADGLAAILELQMQALVPCDLTLVYPVVAQHLESLQNLVLNTSGLAHWYFDVEWFSIQEHRCLMWERVIKRTAFLLAHEDEELALKTTDLYFQVFNSYGASEQLDHLKALFAQHASSRKNQFSRKERLDLVRHRRRLIGNI